MSFTNATRIEALIGQAGADFHQALDDDAITNAANAANAWLQDNGVASTETSEGLKSIADRFALALLLDGMIVRQALRGKAQATGSLRLMSEQLKQSAVADLTPYLSLSRSSPAAANNRNWAFDRSGPLRRGSEAGRFRRTTR